MQAATLILQYEVIFTERMRNQLIWKRTINTTGQIGRNISMDLHMEHLNRDLKSAIRHLSSNVTKTNIDRLGKSLQKLSAVKYNYDHRTKCFTRCWLSLHPFSNERSRASIRGN